MYMCVHVYYIYYIYICIYIHIYIYIYTYTCIYCSTQLVLKLTVPKLLHWPPIPSMLS